MPSHQKWHGLTPQFSILIIIAIAIGGGGVAYGLANLAVQLAAIIVLALNRVAFTDFWRQSAMPLRILVACTLALPAIHLIPLPPAIWANLPGRDLAVDARAALAPLGWHPLSLDGGRTVVALLGLIAPLTMLVIGLSAHARALGMAGWAIVAMGLANFTLGIPQILGSGGGWLLYPENPMSGVLFGTFANRNSTGLFLVICLTLLLHLPAIGPITRGRLARLIVAIVLLLAIVLTQSRSAIALSVLPIASIGLRHRSYLWRQLIGNKAKLAVIIGVLAVALVTVFAVTPGSRLENSLDRFGNGNEAREYIWDDALYSAQKYWPAGAGMGTFDEVFQADESLENLSGRTAGRAHNDYLEIVIEAGLLGITIIAAWLLLIGWAVFRNQPSRRPWSAWSGGLIVAVIACQSAVDYPLRSQALLAVAAYALVVVFHRSKTELEPRPEPKKEDAT